jgi:hypothetical protein
MANTLKFGNGEWYGKKDTILAYNDENRNFKPLPFNFSRESSATVVNKAGLIEEVGSGEPRIDYKDDSKGALLLEPSRTNYLPKSERLDQWSAASNATVEYGFPDPFGGNKAVKATSSSTAQAYQIYWGFTSANTYNLSVYAKRGTAKIFRIDFAIPDNGYFLVNLETGESAGTSGFSGMINTKIEPLDNDWYRISLTSTTVNPNYVRMGANNQEGFLYMAFAQVEIGTYPTSYIPTSGSVVTRLADSCSQTVPDGVIGQTEGTLYFEGSGLSSSVGNKVISLNDGTNTNSFWLYIISSSEGIRIFDGVTIGSFFNINAYENNKFALVYNSTNTRLFINGSLAITIPFKSMSNLNKLSFSDGNEGQKFEGNIKDVRVYNNALTDQELQALTQV